MPGSRAILPTLHWKLSANFGSQQIELFQSFAIRSNKTGLKRSLLNDCDVMLITSRSQTGVWEREVKKVSGAHRAPLQPSLTAILRAARLLDEIFIPASEPDCLPS